MDRFLEKFERLLSERGINKGRIAKLIDAHDAVVRRWGNGKSEPYASQLLRLARELGVSMEYLVDDALDDPAGERPSPGECLTADEQYVLEGYRELVAEIGLSPTRAVRRMGQEDRITAGSPTREVPPS